MGKYGKLYRQPTPATRPIAGREEDMVKMRGGGVGFSIDKWTQLDRFLIIGSSDNTYYADARELTAENAHAVLACAREDARKTVERIVYISESGRAPKNDPAIFALALIAHELQNEAPSARRYALNSVQRVARTASMFFLFQQNLVVLGERWNRSRRSNVRRWYLSKTPDQIAYQALKYRSRSGWTYSFALGDLIAYVFEYGNTLVKDGIRMRPLVLIVSYSR
jgi:60 kDa SS-A/Ro ribonucleoprotein